MREHHEKAIEKLTEFVKRSEEYLALIIAGSVAKGLERVDSDIDVILVITDESYEKKKKRKRLMYANTEFCDYPGGYIDGKLVNLQFLKDVAERGSEPARDAFRGAWIACSKIPELEEILKKIPVYPVGEKEDKITKFYAQFEAMKWYHEEALKRNDTYLINYSATNFILFAGRLILAHNEILFPYHKHFMDALRKAPEKPENFIELIKELLEHPSKENLEALYNAVRTFKNWKIRGFWSNHFLIDTELAWLEGKAYIGDI